MTIFQTKLISDLVNVIGEAYPQTMGQEKIKIMLRHSIDVDFERFATPTATFEYTLLGILTNQDAKPEGLGPFLRKLLDDQRPKVVSFLKTLDRSRLSSQQPRVVVSDMNDRTEVKRVLPPRRRELEIIAQRLRRVRAYKDIHDTLHEIQKECHELMVLEFVKISDQSFEPLQDYYITYCVKWDHLKQISDAEHIDELAGINTRLALIAHQWDAGLRARDLKILEKVEMQLRGALASLSQVNTLLHRSAADMLPDLIRILEGLSSDLAGLEPSCELDLQNALTRLRQMSERFDPLVECHHNWQAVDNEIRRIAEFLPDVVDELEASWPLLDQLINLLKEPSEVWWQSLLALHNSLGNALRRPDCEMISRDFRRYRKIAGDVFFGVDKRLKDQCEQLPVLASDLTSLWDRV